MERERYGPWALILGGSEGIGAAAARMLAADGFGLVLVARKPEPLAALADELGAMGTQVRTVSADMSAPDALTRVRAATDDLEIGLMFYNAGCNSVRGDFVTLDEAVWRNVIAVNVLGQAEFAAHYGAAMCARGRGGMILAGSMSGYIGSPSLAAYCGAKSFSRTFSESLWYECADYNVDVLHLVIGFTATPMMARLGWDLTHAQPSEEVAREALDHIADGPVWIVGGDKGRAMAVERAAIDGRAELVRRMGAPMRHRPHEKPD